MPNRKLLAAAGWISFGLLVAVGCIIAAFVFRPDAAVDAPPSDSPQVAAAPTAPAPAPSAIGVPQPVSPGDRGNFVPVPSQTAAPAASLADVSSVRVRIGPDFPADRRAAIVKALTDAGVPTVKVEQLPFRIATSRVGYYRAADLGAAEALGELITPVIAGGTAVGVRDYGKLLTDPDPGRLDLWIGD